MNDQLDKEIAAYRRMETDLLKHYSGKFVVFFNEKLEGAFDSFDGAAEQAVKKFGTGPYLIRQVGASPDHIPASVAFRVIHAAH